MTNKLFTIGLVTGMAAATAGCEDSSSTVFIRQVQVADIADDCIVQADPAGLFRSAGFLDVSLGDGAYRAVVLVGNQMARRGDTDTLRPETSRVQFFEAEIEVFDFVGGSLGAYTIPVSGFADPGNGTEPGWGLVGLTMADAGSAAAAAGGGAQTIISRVKIYGTSLGGEDVETAYWDFPISVCSGCLGCIEPETCDDERVAVCNLGQDASPDCRVTNPNHVCNTAAP